MPLQVAPMEEADIYAFSIVDDEAMRDLPYAQAMMKPGSDRRAGVESWMRADWGKDPTQHWMKVTDTDTNELIAGAMWILVLDPPKTAHLSKEEKEKMRKEADRQTDEDPNISEVWAQSRRLFRAFDEEFIGDAPKAMLAVLVTHPKHQRRGAGGMLVDWGCKKADEHGVICVLTATEAGLVGYLKHGFEIKKISELDLRPYGWDHTELRRHMIRPAKTAS